MKAMPSAAVKTHNRNAMTEFMYRRRNHVTKQMLRDELRLSLPTITQNLRVMEQNGMITQGELQESTGGRKARSYEFVPQYRAAIGVAMHSTELTICAVDLYGGIISQENHALLYRDTGKYYQQVGGIINRFASGIEKGGSIILGVAFSIQGILSADATTIIFGEIMGNTGLTLDIISQSVHYPCIMIHDSDASAMAELWFDPTISDAVCLYLERRPGGAVIVNGKLYQGPNQCNGTLEHMLLVPGGRRCYCGQNGCMDTYCSPEALLEDHESIPFFFKMIRQGEPGHLRRMNTWMDYVAQTIINTRSVIAGDIIIGGETARYLDDDDMTGIQRRVLDRTPFGTTNFKLKKSRCAANQNIIGAALRFIEGHVDTICGLRAL
ncbi:MULTISPECIES: ROK family protein [Bifidobacterium]|nr:ROK family protein [Bifidobacterium tibiigranuli]MCH3975619.1 ROK family protein [Bifidobacterium tibiigranuli]MCH4189574.1 ROK family protein [Bifidobacterium tibiigranuli]MCH4204447.1 ROK family protein [Bifidobacterium tibiigranuli]MCH4275169.1 ROK family protein [Bifidobacterium tibiigranuli]MCI1212245.1 ROK family protein [Bifidobacterium tibiigranuli]